MKVHNSTYPKGGVSCFADSFVVAESSVLRMKFSAKNPALRVAAKRYVVIFREWVIGQGKDFYYKTIQNPESLVEVATEKIENVEWEGLGYVPSTVFEELTGQEMPYPFQENHNTTGNEWKEESDDLKNMFPKLYAKYPDNI
jgi:hypothetical protein